MNFQDVIRWIVPDPKHCLDAADQLRASHPIGTPPEQLAKRVIGLAKNWAVAAGAGTGIVANPLMMMPAALADIAMMLRIEGQMAGTIAALMDPPTLSQPEKLRADVLAIVFPGAVSQALRQVGLQAGQRVTRRLIEKYLTENLVKDAATVASKFLVVRVTRKAIVAKSVPIVAAGIGAAWNWVELEAVGRRAVRYYQNRAIGPTESKDDASASHFSIRQVMRKLPWRKDDRPALPPPPPRTT
jgi:hypothetical protein